MEQCIPRKHSTHRLPWLTKTLIKKRNLFFKLWKTHGNLAAHLKYQFLRNIVVYLLRSEKRKYFENLYIKNPKSFWRTVRQLRPNSQLIPTLCDGNDCAFTSQVICWSRLFMHVSWVPRGVSMYSRQSSPSSGNTRCNKVHW